MSTPTVQLTSRSRGEDAAAQLGLTVGAEILDGGSAARVFRATAPDGAEVALKVLVSAPGLVDGHDVGSFLGKLTQQNWIRAGDAALAQRYLPVQHVVHGSGWAAYTTPFYESVDSAASLRDGPDCTEFFTLHTRLVKDLIVYGYGQTIVPARPDFVDSVLVGRVPQRRALLAAGLPPGLLDIDRLIVNGRECANPLHLLARLTADPPAWWSRLAPPRLMFPAHGDANTRNVLVGADGLRLIDPRGSTAYWDPIYDLAKTLFSLTVWDPALRLGGGAQHTADGWIVGFRQPVFAGYLAAAGQFIRRLATIPDLMGLLDRDPHWQERLLWTHGLHVLAEAACRLSDPKPKTDLTGTPIAREDLALCHYLVGALLLNDLARQSASGNVDVNDHLRLLTFPTFTAAGDQRAAS